MMPRFAQSALAALSLALALSNPLSAQETARPEAAEAPLHGADGACPADSVSQDSAGVLSRWDSAGALSWWDLSREATLGRPLHAVTIRDTLEIVARRRVTWLSTTALAALACSTDGANPQRSFLLATMLRPRFRERTPFARVVMGADRLAAAGGAIGGLGMVGGLWGEKTTGILMGAGAVLGAVWGGTLGADDPDLRLGIEAEPRHLGMERRSPGLPGRDE